MKIVTVDLFVVIVTNACISKVSGFYPTIGPGIHYKTKSHRDITFTGVFKAIATFIVDRNLTESSTLSSSISDFFGDDRDQLHKMFLKINAIVASIGDVQSNKRAISYIHCHAEKIVLAHKHLISCKAGLGIRKDNPDELLRHLGECLYTLQAFYSNTNWVEMNGNVPYTDFGVNKKSLLPVASYAEDTCEDIPPGNICKNNILVNDKLTSGYHQGWGNVKPARPKGATAGKCSHGGPEDSGRTLVARCGINKDSTMKSRSPHYHLHIQAYEAAVEATKQFFINTDTGVIDKLGDELFRDILNIRRRKKVSLAFAVDYTGSMSDEIAAVKDEIIQFVTSTIGSDNEPADYVLSLFNDPADRNIAYVFTNGSEMIEKVSSIGVTGGGDCPELAAAGILKAIELSRNFSSVIVFTDADAKDQHRLQEVIDAANDKNISITSLLSSQCHSRKRRSVSGRYRRDTTLFFERISGSTKGRVYRTSKTNVSEAISEVIQVVFPTSEVVLEVFEWTECGSNKSVYVDKTLTVLKIKIKGVSNEKDIDFFSHNGEIYTFPSATGTRTYSSEHGETTISIQNPGTGIWQLRCNQDGNYNVIITAQSFIKVTEGMYVKSSDGLMSTLKSSPVVGYNYTAYAVLLNLINGTCNTMVLTNSTGAVIGSYQPDGRGSEFDLLCSADIEVPNQEFQVKLNATDNDGNILFRTSARVYRPSNVELIVTPFKGDATLGKEYKVPYTITNTGSDNDTYRVSLEDMNSLTQNPSTYQHTVQPGESVEGNFSLLPNTSTGIFQYSVKMINLATFTEQQKFTGTVVVTQIERPICEVTTLPDLCPTSSLNTANCSKYTWYTSAQIDFQETELESITHDGGDVIVMQYGKITGITNGPIHVNISGDCCTPVLTIDAVDKDGYITQCHLDLSDGKPIEPSEQVQEPVTQVPIVYNGLFSETFAIVVAGSTCFVLLVIVVFIMIIAVKFSHITDPRKKLTDKAVVHKQSKEHSRSKSNVELTGSEIEWY